MQMYKPAHPGEILKELYFEPLQLSITDAAKALGVTRHALSELVNGRSGVSTTMALRLAKAFGTTPDLWLNMQQNYNLWKTRKKISLLNVKTLYSTEPSFGS
ncbi:HigA family addiction module antidote protein [candidate division KSB1 bacterium]|nr:HigA family addiction module antidote protein [candidate division KSB1 bacterium]